MSQNLYMQQFFKSFTQDISILEKHPKSQNLCKILSETLDNARCLWVQIYSKIKNQQPDKNLIFDLIRLNDIVNTGIDAAFEYRINEGEDEVLDSYLDEEIFLTYTFMLDALHDMEIYYTISKNFPNHNLIEFSKRKSKLKSKYTS